MKDAFGTVDILVQKNEKQQTNTKNYGYSRT